MLAQPQIRQVTADDLGQCCSQVQQEGFFKDGKLDGVWTSYSTNGTKIAVATYKNGEKTGKWFFWNNDILHEVDYTNSKIAAVKTWKRDAIANN